MTASQTSQTYHGSCDCGKVAFEVSLDLSKGTFKCNCRICWKGRFWGIGTSPDSLKLLKGEAELSRYGQKIVHHFCRNCGIKVFGKSADGKGVAISVAALDDLPAEELSKAPVHYVDGIHDNWKQSPSFTAHL
jgi:hypothetical protein